MSSRTFPIRTKNRDLYGTEVYTELLAKPTWFAPLFSRIWSLPGSRTGIPPASKKGIWTFFRGFFALPR
jgi:hypothetical protein